MKTTHISRLLRLITLLQTEEDASVSELSETLGISRRTVFRDISALKASGIPIRFDNTCWRYVIDAEFFLPALNLNQREARALVLLSELAVQTGSIPFREDVKSAIEKLSGSMSPDTRNSVREAMRVVEPWLRPMPQHLNSLEVFETVWQATILHQVLDLRHESPDAGREMSACFHPYKMVWTIRGWYVLGFNVSDHRADALRIDWILDAAPSGDRFSPIPSGAREFFGDAWSMEKGSRSHHVRIRFAARLAQVVDDFHWHPTQQTEYLEDGTMIFEVDVQGLNEICGWVLSHGPDAVVESPAILQDLVKTRAQQTAEAYTGAHFVLDRGNTRTHGIFNARAQTPKQELETVGVGPDIP